MPECSSGLTTTMVTRRQLLNSAGVLGSAGLSSLSGCGFQSDRFLIGGFNKQNQGYGVACLSSDLDIKWDFESESRVHDIVVHTTLDLGAVAARRPGKHIQLFSASAGMVLDKLIAPAGYHYEGHLYFDDTHLWATASRSETSQSALIRYAIGSLTSPPDILQLPGLGPHQMVDAGDQQAWVAIGGWHTSDREILNQDGFNSKLILVNLKTGKVDSWDSPDPKLSIRHLATDPSSLSRVFVAMQYPVPKPTDAPLIYRFTKEKHWAPVAEPKDGWEIFRGYIGSIAADENSVIAASPQGHATVLWGKSGDEYLTKRPLMDAGGAAIIEGKPWLSSGSGQIIAGSFDNKVATRIHWDNHWTSYSPRSATS